MRGRLDQLLANALAPEFRLDEQAVELTAHDRREADDSAMKFGNENLSALDLFGREADRIGVCLQLLAIFGQRQRRAPLHLLQRLTLGRLGRPDSQRFSAL
jgi:hypothetical protein